MSAFTAYPAIFEETGGFIQVSFPDLSEALTFGRTRDEAFAAACDSLTVALAMRERREEWIPPPSAEVKGAVQVLPNLVATILYDEVRKLLGTFVRFTDARFFGQAVGARVAQRAKIPASAFQVETIGQWVLGEFGVKLTPVSPEAGERVLSCRCLGGARFEVRSVPAVAVQSCVIDG